ncbi:MAG TPA: DUF420 domain-containing protein [Vicinamibacteria bacterium]|jgi:uncharacterized membrane protein YozB (DUF420 family)|nr:DUF420 domain-containing protein [Vicinamibacteria bacterium]
MTVLDLPALNASLNAASAALLLLGYLQIRARRIAAHRACMVAAFLTSTLFLLSYLYYHAHVGVVRFHGRGVLRAAYLTLLVSHTILAVAILPLVLVTLARAVRGRFEAHRRLARVTLPLWGYVSVTGVVVYWMLFRL